MRKMPLMPNNSKQNLSGLDLAKYIYHNLLRNLQFIRSKQVWAIDIFDIAMRVSGLNNTAFGILEKHLFKLSMPETRFTESAECSILRQQDSVRCVGRISKIYPKLVVITIRKSTRIFG
jgi:hypothetical protein